jgi:hypothetical protein
VAAQPVSDAELAALHERISRDLAELRGRWIAPAGRRRPAGGSLITAASEMFRLVQAVRELTSNLRPVAVAAAVLAALWRRPSR